MDYRIVSVNTSKINMSVKCNFQRLKSAFVFIFGSLLIENIYLKAYKPIRTTAKVRSTNIFILLVFKFLKKKILNFKVIQVKNY